MQPASPARPGGRRDGLAGLRGRTTGPGRSPGRSPTRRGCKRRSWRCRCRCCCSDWRPSACLHLRDLAGDRDRQPRLAAVSSALDEPGDRACPRAPWSPTPISSPPTARTGPPTPPPGTALAVVRPRRTEEVQTVLRWATANGVAVVPRGAGTGLSGGAAALDGAHRAVHRADARYHRRPGDPHRRRPARPAQRRGQGGGRGVRPVVPAGPVIVRDLHASAATSPPTPAGCAA